MSNTSAKCLLGITDKLINGIYERPQNHKPFRCILINLTFLLCCETTLIEIIVYLFLTGKCRLLLESRNNGYREHVQLDSGFSYFWYLHFGQRNLYNTDDLNGKFVQIVKL